MPFDSPHSRSIRDLDILPEARGHISGKNSWVKWRFQDGNGYCLVGALSLACGSPEFNVPSETELRIAQLLAKQLPREAAWWTRLEFVAVRTRLMSFNDHPRTTHEDVLAVYDRSIHCLASRIREPILV
jgi:hypothetical protein